MKSKRRFVLKNPKRLFEVISILMIYLALVFCRGQWRIYQLRREAQENRQKIVELAQYNNNLRKKLNNLESNSYIETVAREELGLVKKGETLYRFADEGDGKLKAFRPVGTKEEWKY